MVSRSLSKSLRSSSFSIAWLAFRANCLFCLFSQTLLLFKSKVKSISSTQRESVNLEREKSARTFRAIDDREGGKRVCRVTKESDWLPRRRKICVSGNKRERMMTEKEENMCVW